MTEQNKTKVPAELIPAGDYPVVSTDAVMDKQKGKTQEEVNEQVDADVEALQQADTNLQEQILENKAYNPLLFSGLGRVYLRKNLQEVGGVTKNVITQDMLYKGEIGSRVPNENTIFVIQYDYEIGTNITVPSNCVLEFEGGSISGNHTITGQNTKINAGLNKIFSPDITIAGTWDVKEIYPEYFGAKNDGIFDSTFAIQAAVNAIGSLSNTVRFAGGTYIITSPISITKRMTIDGGFSNITTSNTSLDSFITISGSTWSTANISICNLKFRSISGCNAYGIKFDNAMVLYNKLYNIQFSYFNNPCIFLLSSASSGYGNLGVYAHNIDWSHIFTDTCSSIINQSRNSSGQPYIYGGVIDDIHYEGQHPADSYSYIMDLYGFRNVNVSNIVIEGVISVLKNAIVNLSEPCSFNKFYVEHGTGSVIPTNSFYLNMRVNGIVEINDYYGKIFSPFYLNKCYLRLKTTAGSNLTDYPTWGISNIVDDNSASYKITIDNCSFGTPPWSATNNQRRLIPGIDYKSIWIGTDGMIRVDDSEPIFIADLTQLTLGAVGSSLYGAGLFIWCKNAGKQTISTVDDPIFGKVAVVTSTADNNFLNAGIYIDKTKFNQFFGVSPDNGITIVATYMPIVTPANGDVDNDGTISPGQSANKYYGSATLCIGQKLKAKDVPFTTILTFNAMTSGEYKIIRFDNPVANEVVSTPQVYKILEIAIFKGYRFGKCKSKILLQ